MSENDKRGLAGWLGFREPFDYSKARWLGRIVSGVMVLLVGVLFILAIASAVKMLGGTVFGGVSLTPGNSLGVGAVTVALIGAPFVIWRSVVAQKAVDVQEQGHITDRINKSVEGLGATKLTKTIFETPRYKKTDGEWVRDESGNPVPAKRPDGQDIIDREVVETSEPNLEVRIGAIYALERISQDSARDHIQIMEILCAYTRQNAGREDVPLPEGEPTPEEWQVWAREGQQHPRLDIDVALKVIERRHADRKQRERSKGYRLGLERAQLPKIILSRRDLAGADLRKADLKGTNLEGVDFQGAMLENAQLQGAYLGCASLQNAYLARAQLQGSNLEGAALQRADLGSADLQLTYLPDVQFQGAVLAGAKLHNAYLWGVEFDKWVNLSTASFLGAAIRATDCTDVPSLSEHLRVMFGDASVTLPGGQGQDYESWPAHWPKFELDDEQFDEEWRKWQADPDNYTPPEAPEKE